MIYKLYRPPDLELEHTLLCTPHRRATDQEKALNRSNSEIERDEFLNGERGSLVRLRKYLPKRVPYLFQE